MCAVQYGVVVVDDISDIIRKLQQLQCRDMVWCWVIFLHVVQCSDVVIDERGHCCWHMSKLCDWSVVQYHRSYISCLMHCMHHGAVLYHACVDIQHMHLDLFVYLLYLCFCCFSPSSF